MEEVKMRIKNEDGKVIEKPVPENLVSNYEAIGWEVVKEKELPKNEPLVKENK
ncbi:MAG: hypothetical protein IJR03_00185 [Bacteroidales bacterium]|nr:hypothetical protein [Bacteroidales bacterium]